MPFVDDDPGFRPAAGVTPAPDDTDGDLLGAAFRQSNSLVSGLSFLSRPEYAPEPGYSAMDDLKARGGKYFSDYADRFTGSYSKGQTDSIIAQIEQEDADKKLIAANGWTGTLASLAAGTLDPTMFLPVGTGVKAARFGMAVLDAGKTVGKAAFMQSVAQEALLYGTQQTRTPTESALNIGSATLLGGMLGGGAYALLAREGLLPKVAASLDEARGRLSRHNGIQEGDVAPESSTTTPANSNEPPAAAAEPVTRSIGAAASDTRDLSPVPYGLDSVPGVKDVVPKLWPNLNVLTNGTTAAKRAVAELSEVPISLRENVEGGTTTFNGGPAIDREIKMVREGLHVRMDDEFMRLWGDHLSDGGNKDPSFWQRQTGAAPDGKMTFDEFDAAVYDALSTGDVHPVPQVQAAAQWLRSNGFDPIKNRALNAIDGFAETAMRDGETYAPRNWNTERISGRWNEYIDTWTQHLEGEQTRKAQIQGDIEQHVAKLNAAEDRAKIAEELFAKATGAAKDEVAVRLAAAESEIAEIRKRIEAKIEDWGGKSAREAVQAIEAREASVSNAGRSADQPRLRAADRAVDRAVKRILASDRTLTRQELRARAEEIASRQIGTPDGRLPYDVESASGEGFGGDHELRGHTARRQIDLPYDIAKPWLDRSATRAFKSYTHSVLPDAIIAERFGGDPAMTSVMKEIETEYAAKRAAAKSETEQNRLKKQMDADIRIVAGMRDRIRGTFAYDPQMRGLARASQLALKINNVVSSHMMAVASLPDMAGVVFRHGMESAFKDAWLPFFRAMTDSEASAAWKAQGAEYKAFGIGIETHSAARQHALSDINEEYRPASKFERAVTWMADKAFIVNLLAPLTDLQKRMAANAVSHNLLRAAKAVAEGKATKKQVQMLGEANVTAAQAAKIWEQFSNNGGADVKGVLLPNTDAWTDAEALRVFRGAVARDVDIAVVQPGQEKPFFMSKPGLNVLGQYKTFSISATQRILVANLQRRDASSLAGLIMALGMGMMSYKINAIAAGTKTSDRPQDWIKEGLSRGGALGVLDDANSLLAKSTGGKADIYRAIGADKPLSRYASRDAASMFLGPTFGKIQALTQITAAASKAAGNKISGAPSEWSEADTHALRMFTLGSNLPYLPLLFNQVEKGVNGAFGIPMKAH